MTGYRRNVCIDLEVHEQELDFEREFCKGYLDASVHYLSLQMDVQDPVLKNAKEPKDIWVSPLSEEFES